MGPKGMKNFSNLMIVAVRVLGNTIPLTFLNISTNVFAKSVALLCICIKFKLLAHDDPQSSTLISQVSSLKSHMLNGKKRENLIY